MTFVDTAQRAAGPPRRSEDGEGRGKVAADEKNANFTRSWRF